MQIARKLGLAESLVEREYHLLVAIEELRSNGLMDPLGSLCLGGGHGVRACLPQDIQRFSIDLDFYSNSINIQDLSKKISALEKFERVGYGIEVEGRFKTYDSQPPDSLKRGTIAFTKEYHQAFQGSEVDPKFFVTICNSIAPVTFEPRKPKSYIGIEYVKGEIPILSPELIIAGKILALQHRKIKDFYKDVFDIHALLKLSGTTVHIDKVIGPLATSNLIFTENEVHDKFKESSNYDNARNAIKLPSQSREKYLKDWGTINSFVKGWTIGVLTKAGVLKA